MKIKPGQVAITLVAIVLGLMLATQFKNVQTVGGNISIQRAQELTKKVQMLEDENSSLNQQLMDFEDRIDEYQEAITDTDKATEVLFKDLRQTKILAGMIPIKGPGLIITLEEKTRTGEIQEEDRARLISHDDILRLVNELNAAGAEAISINEERVVSFTEIREAGPFININGNAYSPPYVIKGLGDAETLEKALTMRWGQIDYLSAWINVSIKKQDEIIIPAFSKTVDFRYATPVQKQE